MKIKLEIDEQLLEDEVIIRCRQVSPAIHQVHQSIMDVSSPTKLIFYKKNEESSEEYYIPLKDLLFFETSAENVYAHTTSDVFRSKLRLYELEKILPVNFVRVSKSAILNTAQVLSINRNLHSASLVHFHKSHKQVYVSRFYYKQLREKMYNGSG